MWFCILYIYCIICNILCWLAMCFFVYVSQNVCFYFPFFYSVFLCCISYYLNKTQTEGINWVLYHKSTGYCAEKGSMLLYRLEHSCHNFMSQSSMRHNTEDNCTFKYTFNMKSRNRIVLLLLLLHRTVKYTMKNICWKHAEIDAYVMKSTVWRLLPFAQSDMLV